MQGVKSMYAISITFTKRLPLEKYREIHTFLALLTSGFGGNLECHKPAF